jgi:hypothetical protein
MRPVDEAAVAAESGRIVPVTARVRGRPRGSKTKKKQARAVPPDEAEADAQSIKRFCVRNGISQASFFKMQTLGTGPRVMRVGRKVLISRESAERWRRQREQAEMTKS